MNEVYVVWKNSGLLITGTLHTAIKCKKKDTIKKD